MTKTYPDGWLTAADVAELFHVEAKTVSRWATQGRLPFTRTLGGHRRYPEAEIRRIAAEMYQPVNGEVRPE